MQETRPRARRLARTAATAVLTLGLTFTGAAAAGPTYAEEGVPVPTFQGGTITVWGDDSTGQDELPPSLAGKVVTAIGPGPGHTLAITSDGRITAWGAPGDGRLTVPPGLAGKTAVAVSGGGFHSMALTSDGVVAAWGRNDAGQAAVPPSLTGRTVTAISAGYTHSMALTSDGVVTAWGSPLDGRTTVPASLSGKTVIAISAGAAHSLALTSDGKVTAWGRNTQGQATVPDSLAGRTVTDVAAGWDHSVALTSDGTVVAWGSNQFGQSTVPPGLAGKTVTSISSGADHVLALTDDGVITAWGRNGLQQSTVPASLAGRVVTAVAADGAQSVAIATGFAVEGPPTVAGSPAALSTLTAAPPRYTARPDAVVHQWYADGAAIPGATGTSYTATFADVGKRLTFQATATKVGHAPVVSTSTPTGPVAGTVPTLRLSAAAETLRRGQSTTLSWSSSAATTVTASGDWAGARPADGTMAVTPTALGVTTYVLTATNPVGTTTAQVQVRVTRPAVRLGVTVPRGRQRPGANVKVTIRGLEAGEPYTLRVGAKVVRGTATGRPLVRKVRLPKKGKHATIAVIGDQTDRTGTVKVRLRRR